MPRCGFMCRADKYFRVRQFRESLSLWQSGPAEVFVPRGLAIAFPDCAGPGGLSRVALWGPGPTLGNHSEIFAREPPLAFGDRSVASLIVGGKPAIVAFLRIQKGPLLPQGLAFALDNVGGPGAQSGPGPGRPPRPAPAGRGGGLGGDLRPVSASRFCLCGGRPGPSCPLRFGLFSINVPSLRHWGRGDLAWEKNLLQKVGGFCWRSKGLWRWLGV